MFALFRHMRMSIDMRLNDSAVADMLSVEVFRGLRGSEEGLIAEARVPHVNFIARALAHCAGHVMQKPWQAGPCLRRPWTLT